MINTEIDVYVCQWHHGEELTPQNVPEIHQGSQPVQLTSWEKKKQNKTNTTRVLLHLAGGEETWIHFYSQFELSL